MSQSNVIFAFLAVAFLIFITMRGKLPIYMGFLLGDPKVNTPGSSPQPTKTAAASAQSDLEKYATIAGDVASIAGSIAKVAVI